MVCKNLFSVVSLALFVFIGNTALAAKTTGMRKCRPRSRRRLRRILPLADTPLFRNIILLSHLSLGGKKDEAM